MSEILVFGTLRIVRGFVLVFAALSFIGMVISLPTLLRIHEQPGLLLLWLVKLGTFLLGMVVVALLSHLIHWMHMQSHGTRHPKLKSMLSL